jgi:hypothetical protein
MKKLLPIVIFTLLQTVSLWGQQENVTTLETESGKIIRCFTTEKMAEAVKANPDIRKRRALTEARINRYITQEQESFKGRNSPPVYTIPVVVHIIYRTNAQNLSNQRVYDQLQVLNEDYRRTNSDASNIPSDFATIVADTEIEFCLATKDPNNNTTTGITRTQTTVTNIGGGSSYYSTAAGGINIWDPTKYLNIWVCELGGGLLGYTYTPGGAPNGADGVVIGYQYFGTTGASSPYNGGRTTTHEVGHWLNLEHVWGGGNGGCNQDDGVSDTPLQDQSNGGCPTHPSASCGSSDMFMNYMDYVNDNCMNSFTVGQKTRMRAAIDIARPGLLTSQACVIANDDAGISEINNPSGTICSATFTPEVTIKNYGASVLTSAVISYQIDGGMTMTQNWTGSLTTTQTALVQLPQQTVAGGAHTFTVSTSLPNGNADGDGANDQTSASFTISAGGLALPFMEGFEGTTFPSTGWSATNPDSDVTWARTTTAAKTGTASMFMDNWDYPANGEQDWITLPSLDMSNSATVTMNFELSYALYSATGYSDTLRVWASDDCGQTWTQMYEKAGNLLTTVAALSTVEFVPGTGDWRQETIDLSTYGNSSDVQLRFEHVCDYENNLHIDDINITSTPALNVVSIEKKGALNVYPNPTTGELNVDVKLATQDEIVITVYNALGQEVSQVKDAKVLGGNYKLDFSKLAKGIYHIQVVGGGETMTKKVVLR